VSNPRNYAKMSPGHKDLPGQFFLCLRDAMVHCASLAANACAACMMPERQVIAAFVIRLMTYGISQAPGSYLEAKEKRTRRIANLPGEQNPALPHVMLACGDTRRAFALQGQHWRYSCGLCHTPHPPRPANHGTRGAREFDECGPFPA